MTGRAGGPDGDAVRPAPAVRPGHRGRPGLPPDLVDRIIRDLLQASLHLAPVAGSSDPTARRVLQAIDRIDQVIRELRRSRLTVTGPEPDPGPARGSGPRAG